MKKYISILLIVFMFLLTNICTITVFAEDLKENESELIEIENGDSDNEVDVSIENENVALTNGIGAGAGNYVQVNSVFLKNYASYYFLQLKDNFGENEEGTCSYVAAAMLLSYYDTYWDDNIISENYDQPTYLFSKNNPIANNLRSPGIKREGNSELNGKSYETAIAEHSSTHFHFELLRMGISELELPYGIFPWDIVDLLEHYLYVKKGYTSSQVSVEYKNWADWEGNKKEYIINKVEQGIPVIVSGGEIAVDGFAHTYIIYDYDEANDELYCHMGWHDRTNSDGIPDTTHVAFSSIGGTLIGGAITLDFNTSHSHSNNYVDENNKEYCSCFYEGHPAHECCRYYVAYDETYHTYACDCNPSEENLFEHSDFIRGIPKTSYHHICCPDCGYIDTTEAHEYEYSVKDDEYHNVSCIHCGYAGERLHSYVTYNHCYEKCTGCQDVRQVLEHDYTNSYDSKNNLYHYSYCVCGSKKLEEHNFYETDKSKLCYDCEYSIEFNHVHSYTYTPNSNGRSHTKTCRCGINTSETCIGPSHIGGDSYCLSCGQKIGIVISPLNIDEEEALPLIKKEDEEYYE